MHVVPTSTLNNIYKGIAEFHFNYCRSVWGSCGAKKQNKLQKLQNGAARLVTNCALDSFAAFLIQELGWPSFGRLVHCETSSIAYKRLDKLTPEYRSSCFSKLSDYYTRVLRNCETDLQVPPNENI